MGWWGEFARGRAPRPVVVEPEPSGGVLVTITEYYVDASYVMHVFLDRAPDGTPRARGWFGLTRESRPQRKIRGTLWLRHADFGSGRPIEGTFDMETSTGRKRSGSFVIPDPFVDPRWSR